jgi:hypothetical protein
MSEYIEREAALEICETEYQNRLRMLDYCGDTVAWNIAGEIKAFPAAAVAPVVHGHFVHDGPRFSGGVDWWHCSRCGRLVTDVERNRFDYCPWCGARMDGDSDAKES